MNIHYPMPTSRRGALSMFGGLGAGLLGTTAALADGHGGENPLNQTSIDFSDPVQNLNAFIRVFSDIDPDKVCVGYYTGTLYNVVGDWKKVVPLCGLSGMGIRRVQTLEDNRYRVFNRELAFYSDIKTGEFVDRWDNPMNGETVDVFPIQNMFVNAEIAPIFEFDMEGTTIKQPFSPPWEVMNGSALSLFEVHQEVKSELQPDEWPRESSGPVMRISEMFHRHTRVADLENPDLTSVNYVGSWMRIAPYLPWMLMGQTEGHLLYRTSTYKFSAVDQLPKAFLAKAEKEYPQYLEPPPFSSWGTPNNSSFNTYKDMREPMPAKS